ncbi:MAG: sigma 54-interacting transcriptional regulator, partial [Deltaproteobacteria bacterium]
EGEYTMVGGRNAIKTNVRIVAATHRDLSQMIRQGLFREDLYYRLNVVGIGLPPLRAREDDLDILAKYFLARASEEHGRRVKGFSKSCLVAMKKYRWPGNVRELENRIKKAVVLADKSLITADDLDLREEDVEEILPLADAKERFQARYINRVLDLNGGNRTKTARDLGVDPRTIFRHLEKQSAVIPPEDGSEGLTVGPGDDRPPRL